MGKQRKKQSQPVRSTRANKFEYQDIAERLHEQGLISDLAAFGDYRDQGYVRRVTYVERIKKLQEA